MQFTNIILFVSIVGLPFFVEFGVKIYELIF